MGSVLGAEEARAIGRAPTRDVEAYRLYLRGRTELAKRQVPAIERAVGYFEDAVARDADFAEAHAALGAAYMVLAVYSLDFSDAEGIRGARPAVARALAIDSTIAEAHATRGLILRVEWRWEEAADAYARAIDLSPGYATAYQWLALDELSAGRADSAIALLRTALDLDPLSLVVHDNLAMAYAHARDHAEAAEWLVRTAAFDPARRDTYVLLLLLTVGSGDHAGFVPLLERMGLGGLPVADRARTGGFEAVMHDLVQGPDTIYVGLRAVAHTALGDTDAALAALEAGVTTGDWIVRFIKGAPWADPLRDDPRFDALLRRMRLD